MSDGFVLKSSKKGGDAAPRPTATKDVALPNADDGYVMTKWRQERIWVEAIERESKSIREWQDKWSFLAEFDQKGNVKEREKLPERVNMFSDKLPSSFGHAYGHRLTTDEAKQMTSMQHALSTNYRKKRNNDLICYD